MASTALESKKCESVCERNEEGKCVCVCTVPCACGTENQTVDWECDCKCNDSCCRCRFQVKCNRKAEDGPCGDGNCERDVYTCNCKCDDEECTIQINKCKCCEVTLIDCGGASCSSGCNEGEKTCCKEGYGSGDCC